MSDLLELSIPITTDLAAVRALVRDYALAFGMVAQRVELLILAVNEAVTNVLDHGGGGGTLTARGDEQGIVVEIVDDGGTLRPEHLRQTPEPNPTSGMGLYVIRTVCDRVVLDHPDGRSRLRLYMGHSGPTAY
ncbi:ATP-binding protein [Nonomuraea sp. NPDC050783]|uniref:ATP-binding protein n=1 Tax=Nonomuraea sp. NPDC050783 TaxID=3154634 RepID=UPI003467CE24